MLRPTHTVDVAHDVPSARDLMAAHAYDIVFCDLMMPRVSGVELFEELEANDPELARRFVLITGGALTPSANELLASGRCRFVTKPASAESIRALVAAS
jgi:DNA-binding NtrC family response regulator